MFDLRNSLILCLCAIAAVCVAQDESPMATPKTKPDGRVHVQLKDGSLLVGKLNEGELLILRTVVGELSVPTTKIASIQPRSGNKVNIEFSNGDSLTGELKGDNFKLKTSWGEVSIKVAEIAAVISHDRFVTAGTSMVRVITSQPDGETVIWETIHAHPSPYRSVPAAGGYAPATYSAPSAPATPYGVLPPGSG